MDGYSLIAIHFYARNFKPERRQMEISNNTSSSHATFLQNKQVSDAARNAVSPLEQIKEEHEDSATKNANNSPSKTDTAIEKTPETLKLDATQPLNIIKAHQQTHSSRKNSIANYRVTAHEQQLARQAEKAIASYNGIENSQYGQELVNRIELLV